MENTFDEQNWIRAILLRKKISESQDVDKSSKRNRQLIYLDTRLEYKLHAMLKSKIQIVQIKSAVRKKKSRRDNFLAKRDREIISSRRRDRTKSTRFFVHKFSPG